ncbi:MAG: hypothetical protein ABII22_06660 [Candidatus Micrarchaeota archaeon]
MKKINSILFLIAFVSLAFSQMDMPVSEVSDKSTVTLLPNGDANVEEVLTFSASAFTNFKQQFSSLSTFARVFEPKSTPNQMENLDIKMDEMKNTLTATYEIRGIAVNKRDYWEIQISPEGQKITLSAETGNAFVFTTTGNSGLYNTIITSTIKLPEGAKNAKFDSSTNKLKYELPYEQKTGGNILFMISAILLIGAAAFNHFYMEY